MTGFPGKFAIRKFRWYLVDLQDFHRPLIVRKHFDSKQQAKDYNKKYGNKVYHVTSYKEAVLMNLTDGPRSLKHQLSQFSKYEFPPGCKTQYQRQLFRHATRRKLKRKKRPMVKYKDIKEILDHKEMLFFKRLKSYRSYYQAYTHKVRGFDDFKEMYEYPFDIVNLSAIYILLKEKYDCGPFNRAEVAMYIYDIFKERVLKWRCGADMSFKDVKEVEEEFRARGFVENNNRDDSEAWVETIYINPTLYYPEECWFDHSDAKIYDHSVFELQGLVGIPGYTKARQSDSEKIDLRKR